MTAVRTGPAPLSTPVGQCPWVSGGLGGSEISWAVWEGIEEPGGKTGMLKSP